jgi:hypothetical protein
MRYPYAEAQRSYRVPQCMGGPGSGASLSAMGKRDRGKAVFCDGIPQRFHHMCVWTHDIDADTQYFAGLGYDAANLGYVGDVAFADYDTRPLMGCMLEVVTKTAGVVERFAQIAAASQDWDGQNPIRS